MVITVGDVMYAQPERPGEESGERMCELVSLKGLRRVYELSRALRGWGIDTVVRQLGTRGGKCA
jgi:hypothetical protein